MLLKLNNELDKLTNSTDLIKKNKTISYFSFIIKEMISYSLKITKGNIPYYLLREIVEKINKLKSINENLRIII